MLINSIQIKLDNDLSVSSSRITQGPRTYGGSGRGDGLCGLGTCIGASKRGTLHKLGMTQVVTNVVFAVTCR